MPHYLSEHGFTKYLLFAKKAPEGGAEVPAEIVPEVQACMAEGHQFRLHGGRLERAPVPPFDGALWDFDRQAWTDPIGADVRREAQWRNVRLERNHRLASTDWLVARAHESGTTLAPEWVAYRQALRDVTDQVDPFAVVWPIPPG